MTTKSVAAAKAVKHVKAVKHGKLPPDPVNKFTAEAAYQAGSWARESRQPLDTCPYGVENPLWLSWGGGWQARVVSESDSRSLLRSLPRAGLTASILDIDPLDAEQRRAILDWLDTMPAAGDTDQPWQDRQDRDAFEERRPSFVTSIEGAASADSEPAEMRVLRFAPAAQAMVSTTAPLAPLQEIPPANDEESALQDLLRQFDDVGVQLVEEQWFDLDEPARAECQQWLNRRLQGIVSPIPHGLRPYSTTALKDEYTS